MKQVAPGLVYRCGCRPIVIGNRFYHRVSCPSGSTAALAPAEREEWRSMVRAAITADLTQTRMNDESRVQRLMDDLHYVDAHMDDADDDGSLRP